jgi:hypothetical protein
VRRIEDVQPSPLAETGIAQPRYPNLLVVPTHQVLGNLVRLSFSLGGIHGLFDGPARGTLAHFDRPTGLLRGLPRRLAEVCSLFHLDQEFAYHIAAQEFVV